ncbi:MAG: hypothetical protein GY913_19195 [Proteobacteria bacterium]|nr:hypothetical protein [Pseudomonadota bacterium]
MIALLMLLACTPEPDEPTEGPPAHGFPTTEAPPLLTTWGGLATPEDTADTGDTGEPADGG